MSLPSQWQKQRDFYQELIDVYKWDVTPMLELIHYLELAEYCQIIYPSNSHAALGLSLFKNKHQRFKNPMVYLIYEPDKTCFTASYHPPNQGIPIEEDFALSELPNFMDKIMNWCASGSRIN